METTKLNTINITLTVSDDMLHNVSPELLMYFIGKLAEEKAQHEILRLRASK